MIVAMYFTRPRSDWGTTNLMSTLTQLMTLDACALASLFLAIALHYRFSIRAQTSALPPGPRGIPLLGNVLNLPAKEEWLQYNTWAAKYGPIFSLTLLGQPIVILNTARVAFDLFDKRSDVYSSRPAPTMLCKLMQFDWLFSLQPYGERWRRHRAMLHRELHPTAAASYKPSQLQHTRTMLQLFCSHSTEWQAHLSRTSAAIILDITYGHLIAPRNDPYVRLAQDVVHHFNAGAQPGRWLVDLLPFLRYIPDWAPGAEFKRVARRARELSANLREIPFEEVRKEMRSGAARPSFVARMLSSLSETPSASEIETIKSIGALSYGAGADTTAAAMLTFVFALATHPHVQSRAHAEIDAILGTGHLPDFNDRCNLPYVEAIKKEVLRWRPITPLAVPHTTTAEDEYMGYRIPAGTIVVGNAWGMLHNEEVFTNPSAFNPERFLSQDKNSDWTGANAVHDPRLYGVYGFGRRNCLGRFLADNSLWIQVASVLAAFEISAPIDPSTGNRVDLLGTVQYSSGITSHPEPFDVCIQVRKGWEKAVHAGVEMSG